MTDTPRDLRWRRVADATWALELLAFAAWGIGWLLGIYDWAPSAAHIARAVGVLAAVEVLLLANRASRDTLSERMRLAAARPVVPLAAGAAFYGGVTIAAHWPLSGEQVLLLRSVLMIVVIGALVGHFYIRWFGKRSDPPMEHSLLVGGAYGIAVCVCALWGAPLVQRDALLLFLAAAVSAMILGARYFTLR